MHYENATFGPSMSHVCRFEVVSDCGSNACGQLGIGEKKDAWQFQRVIFGPNALEDDDIPTKVACGANHALLLTKKGYVFGAGSNSHAQLFAENALNCETDFVLFRRLQFSNVFSLVDVACGWNFSLALDSQGNLHFAGEFPFHSHEEKDLLQRLKFSQIKANSNGFVAKIRCGSQDDTIEGLEKEQFAIFFSKKPLRILSFPPIVCFSISFSNALFVDKNSKVWAIGSRDKYGLLGAESSRENLVSVSYFDSLVADKNFSIVDVNCGWNHVIFVLKNLNLGLYDVYGVGRNDFGQISADKIQKRVHEPVCILKDLVDVPKIFCGSEHSLFVYKSNESLMRRLASCGWNEHGNCGISPVNNPFLPKVQDVDISGFLTDYVPVFVDGGCASSFCFLLHK